jgi:multidrug efflux pump subunit AcrA (membrane-fusion protein)
LYDALASQVSTLEKTLGSLQNKQDSLASALDGRVTKLEGDLNTLEGTVKTLGNTVNGLPTWPEIDAKLADYLKTDDVPEFLRNVNSLEDLLDALKGDNNSFLTDADKAEIQQWIADAIDKAGNLGGSTESDPDYDKIYANISDKIANQIQEAIDELDIPEQCTCVLQDWVLKSEYDQKVTELENNISAAKTLAQEAKDAAEAAQAAADKAQSTADAAEARANELGDSVFVALTKNDLLISELQTLLNSLDGRVVIIDGKVTTLEGKVTTLEGTVSDLYDYAHGLDWSEDFKKALDLATAASAEASAASAKADSLHNVALKYADSIVAKAIADTLKYYYTKSEVDALFSAANAEMKDSIANLRADLESLIKQYNLLSNRVDLLYKSFDNMVTSILVEQTTNPVVGSANLPGASSLILAGHYGSVVSADGVEFPTKVKGYFSNANDAAYFSGLTFPGTTFSADGNQALVQDAGSLYLTVNPNDVDYEGMSVELVNSRGEAAPGYSLSVLESSDKELTFGYSRSETGFYKTDATITDPAAVKKISVDASELKSSAKSVLNNLKSGSYLSAAKGVLAVAAEIFQETNNDLPAYAVRATWTGYDADGNAKKHTLTSGYKIAATAVPGLSYSFLQGSSANITLPQIPELEALLDKFGITVSSTRVGLTTEEFNSIFGEGGTITIDVPIDMVFDIDVDASGVKTDVTVKVDSIYTTTEVTVDNEKITGTITDGNHVEVVVDEGAITATAKVDSVHITPNVAIDFKDLKIILTDHKEGSDKSTFELSKVVTVQLTADQLKQIISREAINQVIENKFGYISEVLEKLEGSAYNTYVKKLNSFLSKIQNVVNNPNTYLQPALFYSTSSSLGQVSASQTAPSVINSQNGKAEAVLYASSYDADLVVPAYKKYVAVYKYNESTDSWAPYTAGNSDAYNTGKVIDGKRVRVGFHAEETGLYKIAYQALDYSGKVAGRCYYIRVK